MNRFLTALLLVLVCSATSGCYRISYRLNGDPGKTYRVSNWNPYFLFGLVPVNESYEANRLCGNDRLLEVRSSMRPANVLTGLLSGWLTGATTLEGVCLLNVAAAPLVPDEPGTVDDLPPREQLLDQAVPRERRYEGRNSREPQLEEREIPLGS
jgi:hypothetical protein